MWIQLDSFIRESDDFIIGIDGFIMLTLLVKSLAFEVPCICVLWIDLDSLIICFYRPIELSLIIESTAFVAPSESELGI